ncbi:MAG: hypothetical protein ABIP80_05685 [Ferruginibacter sp.]
MKTEIYINASSVIRNNAMYKNGQLVFEYTEPGIAGFLLSIYRHLQIDYPKFYKMDNLSKLGWLANELLLKNSFVKENYLPQETGVVFWNANSSLDTDIKYFASTKEMASPALFVYTLPNIVIGEICIRHQFKGENSFFISAEFDARFMKDYVSNLINNNILQSCISGWVDVLGETGKAVLFLIEKKKVAHSLPFTTENIIQIYQISNG